MSLFCFEWTLFVLNEILHLKSLEKIDITGNDFQTRISQSLTICYMYVLFPPLCCNKLYVVLLLPFCRKKNWELNGANAVCFDRNKINFKLDLFSLKSTLIYLK